jgi:two-component system chemotaxis response regulator CheB
MGDVTPVNTAGRPVPASTRKPVRVLVVDDSIIARAVYNRLIAAESDLEFAGQASTAEEALKLLETIRVDVILLDLEMPGMGGLKALPKIIAASHGAQILVVSSLTEVGAEHTITALAQGAADTMLKPSGGQFDREYRTGLVERIRALGPRRYGHQVAKRPAAELRSAPKKSARMLAIGASTGGILALRQFFENLPAATGMPILLTQHLPESFLPAFAEQIERFSGRRARLAEQGMELRADEVLIAPGNAHIEVENMGGRYFVRLNRDPSGNGCMPSVDVMLASLAQATGGECVAVVLSGMGRDGARGAQMIANAGGTILVQDEASCAVWGMPGSIASAGLASAILPPDQLAARAILARKSR